MKGTIKLYPSVGKLKVGLLCKYGSMVQTIKTIDELYINGNIPTSKVTLMKYSVINNKGIIGQLAYDDYTKVNEGDKVTINTTTILNKMEVGDEVTITKITSEYSHIIVPIDGIITHINGRKATVSIPRLNEEVIVKRHMILLKGKNFRRICYVQS